MTPSYFVSGDHLIAEKKGKNVVCPSDESAQNSRYAHQGYVRGVQAPLNFNALAAGHRDCTRCAVMLVINGQGYDALADATFIQRFMDRTATLPINRGTPWRSVRSLASALLRRPMLWIPSVRWALSFAWKARKDLVASGGRVQKLTFVTHNFMDACQLDPERIDACAFMAITQDGPLSMCAYNARRDSYLLQPLQTSAGSWQPLRHNVTSILTQTGVSNNRPSLLINPDPACKNKKRTEVSTAN